MGKEDIKDTDYISVAYEVARKAPCNIINEITNLAVPFGSEPEVHVCFFELLQWPQRPC